MDSPARQFGSWPETVLRAVVGGAIAAGIALCGVGVGFLRAFMAPGQERYTQAVLRPSAGWIVARYAFAFVATGVLLGVLWPLGRRSRAARAGLGAAIGAFFVSLALPAMNAALPNWPLGPALPEGPHAWALNAATGAVLGAVLGWGFPLRQSEATSAPPTA